MARKPHIFVPAERKRCCGKNRYDSRQEAERVAEEQMLLTQGLLLTTYACTCGCRGWHLTRSDAAHGEALIQ